jgi:hypothetical protein
MSDISGHSLTAAHVDKHIIIITAFFGHDDLMSNSKDTNADPANSAIKYGATLKYANGRRFPFFCSRAQGLTTKVDSTSRLQLCESHCNNCIHLHMNYLLFALVFVDKFDC